MSLAPGALAGEPRGGGLSHGPPGCPRDSYHLLWQKGLWGRNAGVLVWEMTLGHSSLGSCPAGLQDLCQEMDSFWKVLPAPRLQAASRGRPAACFSLYRAFSK